MTVEYNCTVGLTLRKFRIKIPLTQLLSYIVFIYMTVEYNCTVGLTLAHQWLG
jgi:hypothetical protein